MGIFKKTITLGLDYSEFSGGISDVNSKMKLLESEFQLAKEQAKAYGDESDITRLTQEKLSEKIALQTQKVKLSKEAYDNALESGKASDKQLDKLQMSYNKNQTELQRLNNELSAYKVESEEANTKSTSFGDTIRGMASSLGLEVSPALEAVASKFDGLSSEMGTAVLGIGAIIGTFASFSIEGAKMADDLLTLSSTTGIATDELQKLQYASDFVDVSVDTMSSAIAKMTNNMDSARDGNANLRKSFEELHVKITDGNGALRSSQEVFYDTIDALGRVKNETERDALAMDIFGKSAKELNPLIEAGSKRLKELGIEAEDLGMVMSDENLDKYGQMSDAMDRMGKTTDALKNSLGLALLPILTALFDAISRIPTPVLTMIITLATIIASIVMLVKAIKSITDTGSNITKFFDYFQGGAHKTTLVVMGIVAALIALAVIIAVIIGRGDDLNKAMTNVSSSVGQVAGNVNSAQSRVNVPTGYNALGTDDFPGGQTWVGEDRPELVTLPRGSKITPMDKVGTGETNIYYVTIDASNVDDFNKVNELAKQKRTAVRRGVRK